MEDPKSQTSFSSFEFDERLQKVIAEIGWEQCTQVQKAMIPLVLEDKNVLARARTGSGKTGAFLLPIIQKVLLYATSSNKETGPVALIIAPTKELANQIYELVLKLTASLVFIQSINFAHFDETNEEAVNEVVDIVVTTPGRLLSVLKNNDGLLKNVQHVVLDEADLLFSYGYRDEMKKIKAALPPRFQTIMTSATLNEDLSELKSLFVVGPVVSLKLKEGNLPGVNQLTQYHIFCNNDEERFTILLCYRLQLFFEAFKISACVLNSQMPANYRYRVIHEFNEGKYSFIIASECNEIFDENEEEEQEGSKTSAKKKEKQKGLKKKGNKKIDKESGIGRGIDFHFVSNVINFDFPTSTDMYIHRVGRTARGWNKGTAISLVSPEEKPAFKVIQTEINRQTSNEGSFGVFFLGQAVLQPYEIRMKDFESFQLRAREVITACTKSIIREARLAEIRQEILKAKQLDAYFKKNPREKLALEQDRKKFKLNIHSAGIADVTDYMVPKALRGQNFGIRDQKSGGSEMQKSKERKRNRYEKIRHLGEGQFANVYQAKDTETGAIVAIKKIKLGSRHEARDGVNRTALREIKLLQEIHHDNIITLRGVIGHRTSIQLVFDFMDTDLENIIKDSSIPLAQPHIKNMVLQMLLGLEHLHLLYILHRDLKPNNLLLNVNGRIKIADFGLARYFGSPNRNYTHQVITRWYRPPELLYGARSYGAAVDIWSIGCIIAELLLRVPIFAGESDLDQLVQIYKLLGTPTEEDWPNITSLPDFIKIKETGDGFDLKGVFTAAGNDLIELISQCFRFDPLKRWTATQALQSQYFRSEPYACDDSELPIQGPRKRRMRDMDGNEPPITRRKLEFD
uniref:Cyclin-dependent kinase 7 n=1 Tax=Ditylenchus dipsaci TaxID=166011 RepID=A0A915DQT4_9BILA